MRANVAEQAVVWWSKLADELETVDLRLSTDPTQFHLLVESEKCDLQLSFFGADEITVEAAFVLGRDIDEIINGLLTHAPFLLKLEEFSMEPSKHITVGRTNAFLHIPFPEKFFSEPVCEIAGMVRLFDEAVSVGAPERAKRCFRCHSENAPLTCAVWAPRRLCNACRTAVLVPPSLSAGFPPAPQGLSASLPGWRRRIEVEPECLCPDESIFRSLEKTRTSAELFLYCAFTVSIVLPLCFAIVTLFAMSRPGTSPLVLLWLILATTFIFYVCVAHAAVFARALCSLLLPAVVRPLMRTRLSQSDCPRFFRWLESVTAHVPEISIDTFCIAEKFEVRIEGSCLHIGVPLLETSTPAELKILICRELFRAMHSNRRGEAVSRKILSACFAAYEQLCAFSAQGRTAALVLLPLKSFAEAELTEFYLRFRASQRLIEQYADQGAAVVTGPRELAFVLARKELLEILLPVAAGDAYEEWAKENENPPSSGQLPELWRRRLSALPVDLIDTSWFDVCNMFIDFDHPKPPLSARLAALCFEASSAPCPVPSCVSVAGPALVDNYQRFQELALSDYLSALKPYIEYRHRVQSGARAWAESIEARMLDENARVQNESALSVQLAPLLMLVGRKRNAVKCLRKLLEWEDEHFLGNCMLAGALLESNEWQSARDSLRKIICANRGRGFHWMLDVGWILPGKLFFFRDSYIVHRFVLIVTGILQEEGMTDELPDFYNHIRESPWAYSLKTGTFMDEQLNLAAGNEDSF